MEQIYNLDESAQRCGPPSAIYPAMHKSIKKVPKLFFFLFFSFFFTKNEKRAPKKEEKKKKHPMDKSLKIIVEIAAIT